MRCLSRNKRPFYYAKFVRNEELVNSDGFDTGEKITVYSNPVFIEANISSERGETQVRLFGQSDLYDKVIVIDDPKTPIDEYSVLWIDTQPAIKEDGSTDTPYDYLVKRVSRSINSASIAVKKVNVR